MASRSMHQSQRIALKFALGIAGASCLQDTEAWARDDPFATLDDRRLLGQVVGAEGTAPRDPFPAAQPARVAPDAYVFYLSATVDGRDVDRMVTVRKGVEGLEIAVESAIVARLLPIGTANQAGFVPLNQIAGLTYEVDWNLYRISLKTPSKPKRFDLSARTAEFEPTEAVTSAMLNYDARLERVGRTAALRSLLTANVSRRNVTLASRWSTSFSHKARSALHLETALNVLLPAQRARLTVGDMITGGTANGRAIRMAGVQYATNFSLDPDLVTYPLPDFAGDIAVPTSVDLLFNDRRFSLGQLEAGPIEIRNIPVEGQSSGVEVVLTDALGRQRTERIDFHSARNLLAPGLASTSVSVGKVRRRYGLENFVLGDMAVSAVYRRGLTKNLTGAVSAELSKVVGNVGAQAELVLGSLGSLSVEARGSRLAMPDVRPRQGVLVGGDLQHESGRINLRLSGRYASKGYHDLASVNEGLPTSSRAFAATGVSLKRLGRLSLSAGAEWFNPSPFRPLRRADTKFVSAQHSTRIGPVSLFANIAHHRNGAAPGMNPRQSFSGMLGASMLFGSRRSAQVSTTRYDRGQTQVNASLSRIAARSDEVSYIVQGSTGSYDRVRGEAFVSRSWAALSAEVDWFDGSLVTRVGASGSLLLVDGSVFATRPSNGGMLVVDTEAADGIGVRKDNQPQGVTNRSGKRLVIDVTPNTVTRISVDPSSVPAESHVRRAGADIRLRPNAIEKLTLGVQSVRQQLLKVNDIRGIAIGEGTRVRAIPSGRDYVVGLDGELEVDASLGDRQLQFLNADGSICLTDLPLAANDGAMVVVNCTTRIASKVLRSSDDVSDFFADAPVPARRARP